MEGAYLHLRLVEVLQEDIQCLQAEQEEVFNRPPAGHTRNIRAAVRQDTQHSQADNFSRLRRVIRVVACLRRRQEERQAQAEDRSRLHPRQAALRHPMDFLQALFTSSFLNKRQKIIPPRRDDFLLSQIWE